MKVMKIENAVARTNAETFYDFLGIPIVVDPDIENNTILVTVDGETVGKFEFIPINKDDTQ